MAAIRHTTGSQPAEKAESTEQRGPKTKKKRKGKQAAGFETASSSPVPNLILKSPPRKPDWMVETPYLVDREGSVAEAPNGNPPVSSTDHADMSLELPKMDTSQDVSAPIFEELVVTLEEAGYIPSSKPCSSRHFVTNDPYLARLDSLLRKAEVNQQRENRIQDLRNQHEVMKMCEGAKTLHSLRTSAPSTPVKGSDECLAEDISVVLLENAIEKIATELLSAKAVQGEKEVTDSDRDRTIGEAKRLLDLSPRRKAPGTDANQWMKMAQQWVKDNSIARDSGVSTPTKKLIAKVVHESISSPTTLQIQGEPSRGSPTVSERPGSFVTSKPGSATAFVKLGPDEDASSVVQQFEADPGKFFEFQRESENKPNSTPEASHQIGSESKEPFTPPSPETLGKRTPTPEHKVSESPNSVSGPLTPLSCEETSSSMGKSLIRQSASLKVYGIDDDSHIERVHEQLEDVADNAKNHQANDKNLKSPPEQVQDQVSKAKECQVDNNKIEKTDEQLEDIVGNVEEQKVDGPKCSRTNDVSESGPKTPVKARRNTQPSTPRSFVSRSGDDDSASSDHDSEYPGLPRGGSSTRPLKGGKNRSPTRGGARWAVIASMTSTDRDGGRQGKIPRSQKTKSDAWGVAEDEAWGGVGRGRSNTRKR